MGMTEAEFRTAVTDMKSRHAQEQRLLKLKYAEENCDIKIGDIVSDGTHTIIVDKKMVGSGLFGMALLPYFIFSGVWLLKNGYPNKKGLTAVVAQPDIKDGKRGQ